MISNRAAAAHEGLRHWALIGPKQRSFQMAIDFLSACVMYENCTACVTQTSKYFAAFSFPFSTSLQLPKEAVAVVVTSEFTQPYSI